MKEENFVGLHLVYPEDQDTGDLGRTAVSELMIDWKKYLGQIIKGKTDESYFVITGVNFASKNFGLTVRFLNPYYELTGRHRDLIISSNQFVKIIVDEAIELRYKENLKKIREEIQKPE